MEEISRSVGRYEGAGGEGGVGVLEPEPDATGGWSGGRLRPIPFQASEEWSTGHPSDEAPWVSDIAELF